MSNRFNNNFNFIDSLLQKSNLNPFTEPKLLEIFQKVFELQDQLESSGIGLNVDPSSIDRITNIPGDDLQDLYDFFVAFNKLTDEEKEPLLAEADQKREELAQLLQLNEGFFEFKTESEFVDSGEPKLRDLDPNDPEDQERLDSMRRIGQFSITGEINGEEVTEVWQLKPFAYDGTENTDAELQAERDILARTFTEDIPDNLYRNQFSALQGLIYHITGFQNLANLFIGIPFKKFINNNDEILMFEKFIDQLEVEFANEIGQKDPELITDDDIKLMNLLKMIKTLQQDQNLERDNDFNNNKDSFTRELVLIVNEVINSNNVELLIENLEQVGNIGRKYGIDQLDIIFFELIDLFLSDEYYPIVISFIGFINVDSIDKNLENRMYGLLSQENLNKFKEAYAQMVEELPPFTNRKFFFRRFFSQRDEEGKFPVSEVEVKSDTYLWRLRMLVTRAAVSIQNWNIYLLEDNILNGTLGLRALFLRDHPFDEITTYRERISLIIADMREIQRRWNDGEFGEFDAPAWFVYLTQVFVGTYVYGSVLILGILVFQPIFTLLNILVSFLSTALNILLRPFWYVLLYFLSIIGFDIYYETPFIILPLLSNLLDLFYQGTIPLFANLGLVIVQPILSTIRFVLQSAFIYLKKGYYFLTYQVIVRQLRIPARILPNDVEFTTVRKVKGFNVLTGYYGLVSDDDSNSNSNPSIDPIMYYLKFGVEREYLRRIQAAYFGAFIQAVNLMQQAFQSDILDASADPRLSQMELTSLDLFDNLRFNLGILVGDRRFMLNDVLFKSFNSFRDKIILREDQLNEVLQRMNLLVDEYGIMELNDILKAQKAAGTDTFNSNDIFDTKQTFIQKVLTSVYSFRITKSIEEYNELLSSAERLVDIVDFFNQIGTGEPIVFKFIDQTFEEQEDPFKPTWREVINNVRDISVYLKFFKIFGLD